MILCYHHGDLDGVCSAAIVIKRHGVDNVKCVSVEYGESTWDPEEIESSDLVYVVDFTFKDMENLYVAAGPKLVWIDHHKTALEQHSDLWHSHAILGNRELSHSGCGLTWMYSFKEPAPLAVNLVEDMDLWKFTYTETRSFVTGLGLLVEFPSDDIWVDLLSRDSSHGIDKIFMFGDTLLKSQDKRVKYLFENGLDINFHGNNSRVINSTSDASVLGEYVYSKPEYNLAIIWHVKNNKLIVSLRSNKIDCSSIATQYGGGGHPGAAGFSIPLNELKKCDFDTVLANC